MDDNKNKLYKIITRCSILMLVLGYISYKCYFGFQNLINMMAIGEICNTNYGTKALLLLLFRFCFLIIPIIIIILIFNLLIKNIVKYSNPITIKKINIVSNIYFICIIILIILFILSLIFGNKKQKDCWKKEDTTSNLNSIYLNNKM